MMVALAVLMTTIMVPALSRQALQRARAATCAAVAAYFEDYPRPLPATSIGDPYYQWSVFTYSTGCHPAHEERAQLR